MRAAGVITGLLVLGSFVIPSPYARKPELGSGTRTPGQPWVYASGELETGSATLGGRVYDDTGNPVLIALEINDTVALLVAAAPMPNRDAAFVVATALGRLFVDQSTVRLAFVQAWRLDRDRESAPG